MANARRRRTQATDDQQFDMLLSDALTQLLPARHIVAGASWYFQVEGDQLVITRSVATANTNPGDA